MTKKIQKSSILGFGFRDAPSRHGDRLFIFSLVGLCVTGIIMVYSASFFKAFETYRDPYFFFKGHLVRLSIGLLLFLLAYRIDYHHLRRLCVVPLIFSLGLLAYVLFTGSGVNRWITVGGLTLQPSEFARIALVIYLADWCSRNTNRLRRPWDGFVFCLMIIVATSGLVMFEPSYSAAVMILISGVALLVMAGARWLHLLASVFPVVPLAVYMAIKAPYRLERVLNFINPLADPQGVGYQSIQSKIAVGSGQIWGFGIGMSGQKFYFLPEAHCDFIFAILCEETGFIGAIAVLSLFTLFFWRGIRIAMRSRDQFGFLLAGGLLFSIILFTIVNIGVALGFLPVTGLPLPFISYGGSALIANLIACGIILNVSRHAVSPESI